MAETIVRPDETKQCQNCGHRFHRSPVEGKPRWERRKYCSVGCSATRSKLNHSEASDQVLCDNAAWLLDPTAPRIPLDDLIQRLGYTRHESLAKRLNRAGRPDLVEWLYRRVEKSAA